MRLRGAVKSHKSAIARHRQELGMAASELSYLEAECARRGIDVPTRTGEGRIHGPYSHD